MSPLSNLLKRCSKPKAGQLYGTAVAQARQPVFYARMGVDDTPDGRFAMISLHILLILERLSAPAAPPEPAEMTQSSAVAGTPNHKPSADRDPELGRALMEVFVEDLDQSMRELGIGDMGVPKRAKKAMAQFYDYARRYRALGRDERAGSESMSLLLSDMIPGLTIESAGITPLIAYVHSVEKTLADETVNTLHSGALTFPDIDAVITRRIPAPDNGVVS